MKRKTTIFACLLLSLALFLPAAVSAKKTPAAKKKASPVVSKAKLQGKPSPRSSSSGSAMPWA